MNNMYTDPSELMSKKEYSPIPYTEDEKEEYGAQSAYMLTNESGSNDSKYKSNNSYGAIGNLSNTGNYKLQPTNIKKSEPEQFTNMNPLSKVNLDLVLKALFFGAIFYLLSLPDVYKMTKKCCKSVDGVLLHSIVFALVYYVVMHFI